VGVYRHEDQPLDGIEVGAVLQEEHHDTEDERRETACPQEQQQQRAHESLHPRSSSRSA